MQLTLTYQEDTSLECFLKIFINRTLTFLCFARLSLQFATITNKYLLSLVVLKHI